MTDSKMIAERQHLSRRDWIARVLQTSGALVLIANSSAQEHADGNKAWHPVFLTPDQNASLVSLGECIVPGSSAAFCNRVIDLILSIESEKTQRETVEALSKFDAAASAAYGGPFREILPPQQHQLLVAAASEDGALSPQFQLIKEWIADAYWSSEEGMRELGWKGRLAWTKFDGCPHAEKHA